MARGGINKALVQIARSALLARGVRPSIDAVRVELGNTGSKTTIQRYLRELGGPETPEPVMPLNEELTLYISSLVERVRLQAQQALAAERASFEHEQAAARQQREVEQARQEQLQQVHAALVEARQAGLAHEEALVSQLQKSELERERLREAHQQQLRLLEERAAQIRSLEDKYRQAQEALEHYRAQHLLQREQETQRHDLQVQQLQREMQVIRDRWLGSQQELSQLYRDLERLNGEQMHHRQENQRLERAFNSSQDRLQTAEQARDVQSQELQAVLEERAALKEAVKQSLIRQRHDGRLLRSLRSKLENSSELQLGQEPSKGN